VTRFGFKELTLDNWRQPDPVSAGYVGVFPLDGQLRSLTGDDWAYHILAIPLSEAVPDELRRLFEVARGTMLYGWYFYPAYTLASEQVLRVAEAAVARRCRDLGAPACRKRFEQQLAWLSGHGVLSGEDVDQWDAIRHLRNFVSHASDQNILPPGMVIAKCGRSLRPSAPYSSPPDRTGRALSWLRGAPRRQTTRSPRATSGNGEIARARGWRQRRIMLLILHSHGREHVAAGHLLQRVRTAT
jgi:hypothetical protein